MRCCFCKLCLFRRRWIFLLSRSWICCQLLKGCHLGRLATTRWIALRLTTRNGEKTGFQMIRQVCLCGRCGSNDLLELWISSFSVCELLSANSLNLNFKVNMDTPMAISLENMQYPEDSNLATELNIRCNESSIGDTSFPTTNNHSPSSSSRPFKPKKLSFLVSLGNVQNETL